MIISQQMSEIYFFFVQIAGRINEAHSIKKEFLIKLQKFHP
jgi:hypothetical protein